MIHCPVMILRDELTNIESIMHNRFTHSTNIYGYSLFSGNDLDIVLALKEMATDGQRDKLHCMTVWECLQRREQGDISAYVSERRRQ